MAADWIYELPRRPTANSRCEVGNALDGRVKGYEAKGSYTAVADGATQNAKAIKEVVLSCDPL
jgi:hypothetical protein